MNKGQIESRLIEGNNRYIKDEEDYKSPPPAPRYRKNSTINKYLGIDNIPNKYHVNIN